MGQDAGSNLQNNFTDIIEKKQKLFINYGQVQEKTTRNSDVFQKGDGTRAKKLGKPVATWRHPR